MATRAKWVSVSIGLPEGLDEAVNTVGDILAGVTAILQVVKAILDIIKVFIIDVSSPLEALVQALYEIVARLVDDFFQSGLYMYIDGPKGGNDLPYYGANLAGGMAGWRSRMSYAFLNPGVANRPQFSNSASVISFHIVITTDELGEMMAKFGLLLGLFGEHCLPNMNPPRNVTARLMNEDFYTRFYDTSTGRISNPKVAALETLLNSDIDFVAGGSAVDFTDTLYRVQYSLATGDEMIVEANSGAIVTFNGQPDSVLLTWKIDNYSVPHRYIIEKSTTQGGQLVTTDTTDGKGEVVTEGELVRDESGQPIRVYETEIEFPFAYGWGKGLRGAAHEQLAYLDTDVEPGLTYYYRVVPVFGKGTFDFTYEPLEGESQLIRQINAMLISVDKAASGRGDPSPPVQAYVPNPGDDQGIIEVALNNLEKNGQWWSSSYALDFGGWSRVGLPDTFARPFTLAVEQLRNLMETMLATIKSGANEIVAFIELIQVRINTLSEIIEVLQAIIAMLQVFEQVAFGCLFVSTTSGNTGVLAAIKDETLEGSPEGGPMDFTASISILGGTAGAGKALNALRLLFGLTGDQYTEDFEDLVDLLEEAT